LPGQPVVIDFAMTNNPTAAMAAFKGIDVRPM
jgi:hypothetical protein